MAHNGNSGRRPFAGTGASSSASFALATEGSEQSGITQSRADSRLEGSQSADSHYSSSHSGSAASTSCATMSDEDAKQSDTGLWTTSNVMDTTSAEYEIEQLEIEAMHYITVSMEERKKSEALSEELAATKQEKCDVEEQVQQLQGELDQISIAAQESETTSAGLQQTIETLNANIDKLRIKDQQHDADLENLRETVGQHTSSIEDLESQLYAAKTELAQKKLVETDLRQKLNKMKKDLKTQRSSYATMQKALRQAQEQLDKLRESNKSIEAELNGSNQTANTLTDMVKRKTSELQEAKKAASEQTRKLQQDVHTKEEKLDILRDVKIRLFNENRELKRALEDTKIQTVVASQAEETKIARLEQEKEKLQRELKIGRELLQQEKKSVGELTKKVQQSDRRRVRTVAICVDLSGSVSSTGLIGGVKGFYAHLLKNLKRATCKTYVMTVVHGPALKARVKSDFGSPWTAHENALMCEQTDGLEAYVACLQKIKDATLGTGLFLADLQIILIGDGQAHGDPTIDTECICQDFSSNDPPIPIHSVVVQEGTGSTRQPSTFGYTDYGSWHTWDYSARTKGNDIYWGQEGPLPDLGGLLF